MTDWFIGAAMATLSPVLGLLRFGNASFIGMQRIACGAAVCSPACERSTDILSIIRGISPGLAGGPERASRDPDRRFLGGERFAAKLHAAFAGSIEEAAISVGGADISL